MSRVVHDEQGTWVATRQDGLHQLTPSPLSVLGVPEGLPGRNIYPVYEDRDVFADSQDWYYLVRAADACGNEETGF